MEFPANCYIVFDRHVLLFNSTNFESFGQHQLNLFNRVLFAQPERTNFGVRNLYFYVKAIPIDKKEPPKKENEDQKPEEQKEQIENEEVKQEEEKKPDHILKIEKNPRAPQLIVVPLSATLENNNLPQIKMFAEQLEAYLKKNASVTSPIPYHYVQLVFTMQPIDKEQNEAKLKQVTQFVKSINKINTKSEYVSAYFVSLHDIDFEVICKSASFALVSRNNASQILQKLNEFKCPCLCLCNE